MIGVSSSVDHCPVLAELSWDDRGLWLHVGEGIHGIFVNGRPVRHLAWIRPGDAIYADHHELLVQSLIKPGASDTDDLLQPTGSLVLRGIAGPHHGRCFLVETAQVIGRAAAADIQIEDARIALRQIQIERCAKRLHVRQLDAGLDCYVNGHRVREAWLTPGDQLVLDGQYRYVVEGANARAVLGAGPRVAKSLPSPQQARMPTPVRSVGLRLRWPWLLLSAFCIALILSGLLWFWAH